MPTPLGPHGEPDLSYVTNTGAMIGKHAKPGVLVVLAVVSLLDTTLVLFLVAIFVYVLLSWISPELQARLALRPDCLRQKAGAPLTHDNLFHSMLGLLDVNTTLHRPALDIFAGCR